MDFKKLVLVLIVLGESTLGLLVIWQVNVWRERKSNVLGASVTRIPKESLIFPKSEFLSNYFELQPNYVETDRPDWLGYTATYRYNDDGIRAEGSYAAEKPINVFRIITLGDSFTFGQFLNEQDTYPRQLEKLLNGLPCTQAKKFEVINLGVGGYDIEYSVERYRLRGQKYNPDLVVWLVNEHNVLQLRDLLTPLEEKIRNETSEAAKLAYYAKGDYYFATAQAAEELEKKYGDEYIFSVQRKALERFSSVYKGPLVIVMFGDAIPKTKGVIAGYVQSRPGSFFRDIRPLQDSERLPDNHPNTKGAKSIAQSILEYLKEQKLISCF